MFRMKEVGGKIAARRKEMNMTQMELADRMGVSFQAVSNWERGNSMPDIAKLPDISETLGISIDDLLVDDAPTRLIRHILDGDEQEYIKEESVCTDTVADIAPLLKPQQTEALLHTVLESDGGPFELSNLIAIAPFVGSDFLHTWVMKIASVDSVGDIVSLAPFLSETSLNAIVDRVTQAEISPRALVPLAPFLSEAALDKLAERATADPDLRALTPLAPFLSEASLDRIVQSAMKKGVTEMGALVSLAPFLPEKTLDTLALAAINSGDKSNLISLAPFLSKGTLEAYASKLFESMDIKTFKKLAPFLYARTWQTRGFPTSRYS